MDHHPLPTVDTPDGIYHDPQTGTKTFIPLENNPTVFTNLAHTLGLSPDYAFHDVYSLSDTAHIPRPIYAVILIIPATIYHRARSAEYAAQTPYTGKEDDEVLWIRQTIGHACGLMSLLHAVLNMDPDNEEEEEEGEKNSVEHNESREENGKTTASSSSTHDPPSFQIPPKKPTKKTTTSTTTSPPITPNSILSHFLSRARPLLNPDDRARLLYNDTAIEAAHMAAAHQGQSRVPAASEGNFNHFVTFVKTRSKPKIETDIGQKKRGDDEEGRLWELNGGMKGPVDRGTLEKGEDVLSERGVELGVGGFLKYAAGEADDVGFSLIALAGKE